MDMHANQSLSNKVNSALAVLIEDQRFNLTETDDASSFSYENRIVHIAVDDDRSQFSVWSMCLLDVESNVFTLETINRWTAFKLARVVIINGHAVVEVVLPGESFSIEHVVRALTEISNTLDQIDSEIRENSVFALGGRRFS
jgi:hypothetical protein